MRQLDELLVLRRSDNEAIDTEIERAALLGALDRRQEAQQAFIDILRGLRTHFSALNEFGTLLTHMGAIDAACRVYSEAIRIILRIRWGMSTWPICCCAPTATRKRANITRRR